VACGGLSGSVDRWLTAGGFRGRITFGVVRPPFLAPQFAGERRTAGGPVWWVPPVWWGDLRVYGEQVFTGRFFQRGSSRRRVGFADAGERPYLVLQKPIQSRHGDQGIVLDE